MPFKSKAQQRLFFAKEERGELPKGKALEWAHHTKNIKKLPEHVKKSSVIGDAVLQKVAAAALQKTAAQGAYRRFKGAAFPTLTGIPDVGGALAKHVGGAIDQKTKAMENFAAAWDAVGKLPTPEARARAATDVYLDVLKGSKRMGPTAERYGKPIQETVLKALTRLAK